MITRTSSRGQPLSPLTLLEAFLLPPLVLLLAASTAAQNDRTPIEQSGTKACIEVERTLTDLTERGPQKRALSACEKHSYPIALAANQYIRVATYLHGIDVILTAFAPDGSQLEQVTSPYLIEGKKSIWWMTKATGAYRVEIRPSNTEVQAGRYDILVQRLLEVTEETKGFIAVDQGTAEGLRLQQTGTEEALQRAIPVLIETSSLAQTVDWWPEDGMASWYRATSLMYLGEVYASLGEYDKALVTFQRALVSWGPPGQGGDRGWAFHNIGTVYEAQGQKQKALDNYFRSLRAYRIRDLQARAPEGGGLGVERALAIPKTAIGALYKSLGEYHLALDYLGQALEHWHRGGEIRGEARALTQIAEVHWRLGDHRTALDYYAKALRVYQTTSDYLREDRTLCAVGRVYLSIGDHQKAQDNFKESVRIARVAGDRFGRAEALTELGRVYNLTGDDAEALDCLTEALPLYQSLGIREGEAKTLYYLARVERDRGNLPGARERIEEAVKRIEAVRASLIDEQLRASYFATVRDYYEFYVDLLMRMNPVNRAARLDAEALRVSERGRARSLIETLASSHPSFSEAIDPAVAERVRNARSRLNARTEYQKRLLSGSFTNEEVKALWREIEKLTAEYDQAEELLRSMSQNNGTLVPQRTLDAAEIQKNLDNDTLLLEYALGDERSYLWAVTLTAITSYELPGRAKIETAARRVYELLTARNRRAKGETPAQFRARCAKSDADYYAAANELSSIILKPVASQLGTKRLVVVADGVLQFIPFAALPEPKDEGTSVLANGEKGETAAQAIAITPRPLIWDHEIVNLPSASVLSVLREGALSRKPASKAVAVFADPVFAADDPRVKAAVRNASDIERVSSSREHVKNRRAPSTEPTLKSDLERAVEDIGDTEFGVTLPRLLSTRWEADQISSLSPKQSLKAVDFRASRETVMREDLQQYRIVHFASHALIDTINPQLSGLVLSLVDEEGGPRDGYLRAPDISQLKLSADLVVLSACRTGLGKEVRGEGMIGLTRGFMYAGAPRVVVSLWRVNDQATAELMARFYRKMFTSPPGNTKHSTPFSQLPPAAALRAAQIDLLKHKRWQSPYFWAGFTLQGEWN